jgi:hypothetical protein
VSRNRSRPIPGMAHLRKKRPLPASITALHEAAHAVFAALTNTEGFAGVDIIRRGPRERIPGPHNDVIPEGMVSFGLTRTPTPEVVTPKWAWKLVIGTAAPMALTVVLDYDEDGFHLDKETIRISARS